MLPFYLPSAVSRPTTLRFRFWTLTNLPACRMCSVPLASLKIGLCDRIPYFGSLLPPCSMTKFLFVTLYFGAGDFVGVSTTGVGVTTTGAGTATSGATTTIGGAPGCGIGGRWINSPGSIDFVIRNILDNRIYCRVRRCFRFGATLLSSMRLYLLLLLSRFRL